MVRTAFNVQYKLENKLDFETIDTTFHFSKDRSDRHAKILDIIGSGKYITSFLVDTNHPNGMEIHNIFNNGIIVIQNERTRKVITELIARPGQLTRYWKNMNSKYPLSLRPVLDKAQDHVDNGYNYW